MDDELENFIRERRARVAEDKASLLLDLPYMEMKAKPRRAYESTVKENIPPKSAAPDKEDSSSVGLPLGVEYDRKKQRLQQELRMDYRRYVAQQRLLDNHAGVIPKQRPPSRRDAATLTDDSRASHRALPLAGVRTLRPDEDEEEEQLLPRHCDRLGKTGDEEEEEEEEEEYFKELEVMEGRRRRHVGVEAGYEKRRASKSDGREKRENLVGRGSGALTRNMEFSTGLIIGAVDTEDARQRKKERYRKELEEQIAEQHRNRRREKDLELKVAATGANDPEKRPDRIRQFGLSRRGRHQQVPGPSAAGDAETWSRGLPNNVKRGVRDRETPPPEHPHVAFQSPLLEYSSALSLGGRGLTPSSQPAGPSFPRALDTPRIPVLPPPHPPSALSEAYRTPYGDPHHYYGTRNLLDPNMAYYGHLTVPGAGLPMSYWNLPAGGAAPPSRFGHHSPPHSGSSFPEPPPQPTNGTLDSLVGVFPADRSRSTRERVSSYREALKQQIQEQQEQRRVQQEERERYDAQLEADMKDHQPWGRGGGGAPLRDSRGNLIADLNQMHKLNVEAYSNPAQRPRRAAAARRVELPDPEERVSGPEAGRHSPDASDRLAGFTQVQTPQFARGSVFANQPSQQQIQDQVQYKAYLKQQIDEKKLKMAEERERTRLEEEREERRLSEQRARIQREFDEEQEKKRRKEIEQKAKNEELVHLAEQRKKEVERRKNEEEEEERAALRRQYEMERQARVDGVRGAPSPPIPTLQRNHRLHQYSPRPPTVDSQHSIAPLSERSLSGLQSPPVPARRNQLRAAGAQRDVFGELSALRRHLRSEEKRLEARLEEVDWDDSDSPLGQRRSERPLVDVFDMARLRLQAPVRRPSSRNLEPRNLMRIHDSLQLKSPDAESRLGFGDALKMGEVGVASRRRRDYRDRFSSQRSTVQDDYVGLSPPQQNDYLRSVMGGATRGSLLESESAFIDPLGEAFPDPRSPERGNEASVLSARERRRLAKQPQRPQDHRDDHTGHRLQLEAEPGGQGGSRRHVPLGRHGNTAGTRADLSDGEDSPPRHHLHRRSSVETVSMDTWLRPGSSDTLRCLEPRRQRMAT